MDIFDGLHPQCADSIDVEKSDSSEDSDMEVTEQLIEPAEADLARLIVDVAESELPTRDAAVPADVADPGGADAGDPVEPEGADVVDPEGADALLPGGADAVEPGPPSIPEAAGHGGGDVPGAVLASASPKEQVQKVIERFAQKMEGTRQKRRRPDVLEQACMVLHYEQCKNYHATARKFRLSSNSGVKQVSGYVKKKATIMELLVELEQARKALRSRKSVSWSGRHALHKDLESTVVEWRWQEIANGNKIRPSVLWRKVREVTGNLGITAKLGRTWKRGFCRRHNLHIVRQKRSMKISKDELVARMRAFHTYVQAMHRLKPVSVVGNFDEAPVSFNGNFCSCGS